MYMYSICRPAKDKLINQFEQNLDEGIRSYIQLTQKTIREGAIKYYKIWTQKLIVDHIIRRIALELKCQDHTKVSLRFVGL